MVLLDNIMVFWVLLSIYLLRAREPGFHWHVVGTGLRGFRLTKENAIFFAPTIIYLLIGGPRATRTAISPRCSGYSRRVLPSASISCFRR